MVFRAISPYEYIHWKLRLPFMAKLPSLGALQVVVLTICLYNHWGQSWHHDNSRFSQLSWCHLVIIGSIGSCCYDYPQYIVSEDIAVIITTLCFQYNLSPIEGVATMCHQVRCMCWGCETIFWPPYIMTPGSIYRTIFWPRGQYIVTIFWPPSRYFDPPHNSI